MQAISTLKVQQFNGWEIVKESARITQLNHAQLVEDFRPKRKTLKQLEHELEHYQRIYCGANTKGRQVLRFHLRKLCFLIKNHSLKKRA